MPEMILLRGWFASSSQFRIQRSFPRGSLCGPDVIVIEHFFKNLEAPLRLVALYIDHLESGLVGYGVSREISKASDCIESGCW